MTDLGDGTDDGWATPGDLALSILRKITADDSGYIDRHVIDVHPELTADEYAFLVSLRPDDW